VEPDLSWAAYVRGHPERLPRPISGAVANTWGDVTEAEYRRVTRNWRRWQRRRLVGTTNAYPPERA
jgi:hypothetical protein